MFGPTDRTAHLNSKVKLRVRLFLYLGAALPTQATAWSPSSSVFIFSLPDSSHSSAFLHDCSFDFPFSSHVDYIYRNNKRRSAIARKKYTVVLTFGNLCCSWHIACTTRHLIGRFLAQLFVWAIYCFLWKRLVLLSSSCLSFFLRSISLGSATDRPATIGLHQKDQIK
jgi:hypothetical protein